MCRKLPRPPAIFAPLRLFGSRPVSTRPLPCMFDWPAKMKTFSLPLPGRGFTVCQRGEAEVLGALFASPTYRAVIPRQPGARLLVVRLAWNDPFKGLALTK